LLAWIVSWNEFAFAIILSPPNHALPIMICDILSGGENPLSASAFAMVLTGPVIIMTIALQKRLRGDYLSGGMHG
jgi:trehalose transport system permease protein